MKNFILNLQFIFKPMYWFMHNPYSLEVDLLINKLLDNYKFTEIGEYTAILGKTEIWIANKPYGAINVYSDSVLENYRPSRLTIKRALRLLKIAEQKEAINKNNIQKFVNRHYQLNNLQP